MALYLPMVVGKISLHISALETSGIKNLSENQKVSYDEARNKDKISAGNIKLID